MKALVPARYRYTANGMWGKENIGTEWSPEYMQNLADTVTPWAPVTGNM